MGVHENRTDKEVIHIISVDFVCDIGEKSKTEVVMNDKVGTIDKYSIVLTVVDLQSIQGTKDKCTEYNCQVDRCTSLPHLQGINKTSIHIMNCKYRK